MRLILPCHECLAAGRLGGAFAVAEYRDDDRYESVCPVGHRSLTVLQQHRFELLFEMGAYAILDGYYREAVSAFSGSLERFLEFATRVLLLESSGSDELFHACWKHVASQSERQLGAFTFLWSARFKSCPPLLTTKLAQFRNDVIHRGKLPTRSEALAFGNNVLGRLNEMIDQIELGCPDQVAHTTHLHLRKATPKNLSGPVSTFSTTTIISLSVDRSERTQLSLDAHLGLLEERRRTLADFIKLVGDSGGQNAGA